MSIANLNDREHNITVHELIVDVLNGAPYVPSTGDVTLAPVNNASNAFGATLVGQQLNLEAANAFFPGVVTAGDQQFGGNKDFLGTVTAANISGTNTGDVTLAPVGASPNPDGASLAGQVLTLQPADNLNPGLLSTGLQTIGGDKFFNGAITAPLVVLPDTSSPNNGVIRYAGQSMMHNYSSSIFKNNIFVGPQAGASFLSSGTDNTALGKFSMLGITSGNQNTGIGSNSLAAITTGSSNIALGSGSATSIVAGDNNIYIGNNGSADTTGAIVIGSVGIQNSVNLAGVPNTTADVNARTMMINNTTGAVTATVAPVNSLAAMDSTIGANANGCAIVNTPSGLQFCLNSATDTRVGCINLLLQSFKGSKQFLDGVIFGNVGAAVLSALNYYELFNHGSLNPTLDSGTIDAGGMSVRGIVQSQFTNFYITKIGRNVSFTIPRFNVSAITGGPPQVFNVTGPNVIPARFRPTYDVFMPALIYSGSAAVPGLGIAQIFTASGQISLVLGTGGAPANYATNFGLAADLCITYEVVL